ncbi:MAG TPA: ShlB/FhaC/HecB family hemolysin secretion/activation protein [Rhodocyclaceae bacterium]|nr:ShlB/FhaC/HecB family hemolysin secretion/activation protein [Rhodocyclaceae bacterium]
MNKKIVTTYLALTGCALQAFAQGSALQGPLPPQVPSAPSTDLTVRPPASPAIATPAGPRVTLRDITLSGNTLLDSTTLQAGLGPVSGQSFDLAGLEALAAGIERQYRAAGYPFTQAVLPPQDLKDGTLRIQVVEGRYGRIQATGTDPLPASAQPFLDFGLRSGDAIENARLERTLLILDDQPGMKIRPVIQPGDRTGEADLSVNVERVSLVGGEVGLDNTGARSTGQNRARGAVFINSPFRYGDKISINALATDQSMLLGSLDYEMPIGASGLRGQVGYAYTNYQLGAQFAALDAKGYAKITTARLSYPLIRSQASNMLLSAGYQHKNLEDRYDSTGLIRNKHSDGTPVAIQFDRRDTLLGGGVTYGSLTWLPGSLSLDPGMDALDRVTARTAGHFNKLNLDVARIQQLTSSVHAYARYSGQWADKNLDSSEKFNLGGFYGVRAFPLGEGVGDQGWFTQLEIRYDVGVVTPFAFYDAGHVETNAKPWDVNSASTRRLAGSGVGVRSLRDGWSLDATLAWRTQGGAPTSEDVDRNPRLFVMIGRRF